ncbi:hypothetical protein BpHYR1_000072 [Brachionus plicatilis]|uniref:Post-SET domain-containing protein n=1 Tax=Brachionus plicatilis TaxID=10195 RepID=A0A3M7SEK2_BRAPC|nr:hypothetical protein BpHYR1_000072 [Brachionus plicatilis]
MRILPIAIFSHAIRLTFMAAVINICPNEKFCKCNWEFMRIECYCRTDECRNALSINSYQSQEQKNPYQFRNKNYRQFKEVYLNEIERLDKSYFYNATFSDSLKLSVQFPNILGQNFLSDLASINNLEIIYSNLVLIEPDAFDHLICDTLSFISLGDNYPLDIKSFGKETFLKNLNLDYHSSNNLKSLFVSNSPGWKSLKTQIDMINLVNYSLTENQLNRYWSSEAKIEKIYIQEAKGIKILDHTFVPKFKDLKTIEIYFSDLSYISPNFAVLHAESLKSLTIRQSNLEIVQQGVFGFLKNLEYLDLSSNPIKQIELKAFQKTSIQTLLLHSISEYYHVDNSDICMLSFLPCGINVHLDSVVNSWKSCSHIFINELRNKEKRLDFSMKGFQHVEYLNAYRDCKLGERLVSCLAQTNRRNHCLLKQFQVEVKHDTAELTTKKFRYNQEQGSKQFYLPKSINELDNQTNDSFKENDKIGRKSEPNRWMIYLLCTLVFFCLFQILIAIFLIYLFSNRKNSVDCIDKRDGSSPKPISVRPNNEFLGENDDQMKSFEETRLKRAAFGRPKYVPRAPIQTLRDTSFNLRY